ncbi:MAG: hypothetical protein HF978_02475 [Desulfobacteraceae bacterium]|nr:putative porin [Desulfobacteraceae bacterium]MBC2754390.1 hypothetical protein [Desulfobacteraceae bacterium]
MNQKSKMCLFTVLCFLGVYLCMPVTASANLVLQDFIESLEMKGDLRVRYEYKEKDKPDEDPTDRMRTRFRLGMKWTNPEENWKIAAGLATGGTDSTSTNDTWSDGVMFETGDIRLDYAYAEHKLNNFKFIAGQHKNPYKTTWALWDSDVRPAGFSGQYNMDPVFVTLGWYDVLYYGKDMATMEAIQVGANVDIFTAALAFYNYHDADEIINGPISDAYGGDYTNMDPDYKWQIIDLYMKADIKTDMAKISPHAQVFYNMGAKGDDGQSIQGGDLNPEDENLGWLIGVKAKIDRISLGVEYAEVGADSCIPLLKDSDWGGALDSTDVKGFKIGLGYSLTKHCSINGTAYLYEAKERDIDQDPKTYHLDLKYKF